MSTTSKFTEQIPDTPKSEASVYFDAPIMHFFSKKRASTSTATDVDGETASQTGTITGTPAPVSAISNTDQKNLAREPSVAIAPNPIINKQPETPSDVTDNEPQVAPTRGVQLHDEGPIPKTSTSPVGSDSGYDSPITTAQKRDKVAKLSGSRGDDLKPVPIVWTGGDQPHDEDDEADAPRPRGSKAYRSSSVHSNRTGPDRGDARSFRSTPSGRRTPGGGERRRRASLSAGSFRGGAGTVGPNAEPDDVDEFLQRRATLDASLSKRQKAKIGKEEAKEGKRLAKVIKAEGVSEKRVLEISMKELADLQKMQKAAIKEEAKANYSHSKALRVFHKEEMEYLAARAKYEKAQTDLQLFENAREAAREHASDVTEMLQEKNKEVEWLRAQKAADSRERETKLRKLSGKSA